MFLYEGSYSVVRLLWAIAQTACQRWSSYRHGANFASVACGRDGRMPAAMEKGGATLFMPCEQVGPLRGKRETGSDLLGLLPKLEHSEFEPKSIQFDAYSNHRDRG